MVVYHWTPPSLLPAALPWVGLCVLLLAPANRSRRAWWLLVPVIALLSILRVLPDSGNNRDFEMLRELARPMVFGIAAVWALGFLWAWKHRFLVWMGLTVVCSVTSSVVLLFHAAQGSIIEQSAGLVIPLLIWSGLLASELWLGALLCRRLFQPGRVLLSVFAASLVVHAALAVPIVLFLKVVNGPVITPSLVLGIVLLPVLLSMALLLPFLALSFANEFYRERLQSMLHLSREPSPPMLKPEAAVVAN